MLKSLSFFIKYFLFWVLFFIVNRIFFEIWHFAKISPFPASDIFKTFSYGLQMDASMAAYFCIIPFLIIITLWFIKKNDLSIKFINYYTYTLIVITALINIVDINIYREWGTKFNNRAIDFILDAPGEAMASTSSSPIFMSTISLLLLMVIGFFLYQKIIPKYHLQVSKTPIYFKIIISFFIISFSFLAIRGGIGIAPMNPSKVYFSTNRVLNLAAINSNWFLMSNIIGSKETKTNPYHYFEDKQVKNTLDSLFKPSNNYPEILTTKKPNIVIIIMESFTADVVKELNGESNITPNFSKMIKEGLLFNHIYSASDRTDKGIVAVLSGFPSQAINSVIKQNDKQANLPSIPNELSKIGYKTSFIYGGDLSFSNFRSYLFSHGINNIKDLKDFDSDEPTSKWGFADNLTFQTHLDLLKTEKEPFFAGLLTLSNHEPFFLKGAYKFGDDNVANKFRSTSFFTDQSLYQYITAAKKEKWYRNTLFVIVADHGHRLPTERFEISDPNRYHIPLLLYGGALKKDFQNKVIDKVGNQIDIASILLNQLHLPDSAFHYSKNLLSPEVNGFAFFSWDNGFGFINQTKAISYDPVGNYTLFKSLDLKNKEEEKQLVNNAKSLMQSVYKDYLKL